MHIYAVMKSATLLLMSISCLMSSSSARRKSPRQPAASAATAARSDTSEPRSTENDPCYMDDGSATRCIPDFINAAYERQIVASSTCGQPPVNFCSQHPTIVYQHQQQESYSNRNKSRDNNDDDDNDDNNNITNLGRRICTVSGDDRETLFLFQRISVAIQRFNSVLLHDCFCVDCPDE